MSTVRRWVSQYTLSAVPAEHRWADDPLLQVNVTRAAQRDGSEKWAVRWMGSCLHLTGVWDHESIPSERTDEWLAFHRFDLQTALRLAEQAAPDVTVNGMRAGDL